METATQLNEVSVIERSVSVFQTAGEIFTDNKIRAEKALKVGQDILASIQQNGMNADLDQRAMNYLININKALPEMKANRAEVTQIMDELKKMYTGVENEIDVKKDGTIPFVIQMHRNEYVKQKAIEEQKRREEAERIEAKGREAIEIKAQMTDHYKSQYNQFLLERKQKMLTGFNNITLENYDDLSQKLTSFTFAFSFQHAPLHVRFVRLHTPEEVKPIAESVVTEFGQSLAANYMAEMNLLKSELVDKLPSKKNELLEQKRVSDEAAENERKRQEQIEKSKGEEKKRLEEENRLKKIEEDKKLAKMEEDRKLREAQEEERLKKEAEEALKTAELQTEMNKQADQTILMFDKEATLSEAAPAPEVRQGYDITLTHQAGYVQIFQFWFENEGKNLPLDKMGKTSLDQMKSFCEKIAHKNNTKIESKFIIYEPSYKAVNRKSVKA